MNKDGVYIVRDFAEPECVRFIHEGETVFTIDHDTWDALRKNMINEFIRTLEANPDIFSLGMRTMFERLYDPDEPPPPTQHDRENRRNDRRKDNE